MDREYKDLTEQETYELGNSKIEESTVDAELCSEETTDFVLVENEESEMEEVLPEETPERVQEEADNETHGGTTYRETTGRTSRDGRWDDIPTYQYGGDGSSSNPQRRTAKRSGGGHPKAWKWVACVGMAVVFGVVSSVTFRVGNYMMDGVLGTTEKNAVVAGTTQLNSSNSGGTVSDIADIAEEVMPSVVSITNLSVQQVQNFFFGVQEQQQQSSGSGIIVGQSDTELLVVTNNHVVEGSTTLTVSFIDDESVEAQIKGRDANKDIAVVAVPLEMISDSTLEAIKVATMGDSTALRVGETTIAIGNALGYGQSVTTGIVSALDREMEDIDVKLIQTDAAINPGNSGGALMNAKGEVIGINTAKIGGEDVEGMGYAIPISEVNELINTLMNRETREKVADAERGYIGIYGETFSADMAAIYKLPEGVFITDFVEGGAAEKSDLNVGNIITKLDGISVSDMEDLQEQLSYYRAGETVVVTVQQVDESGQYTEKEVEITLGGASVE